MEDKIISKQENQCYCVDELNRGSLKQFIRIIGDLAGLVGMIFNKVRTDDTRERVEIVGQVTVVSFDSEIVVAIEDVVAILNPGYACQISYYSDGTVLINVFLAE